MDMKKIETVRKTQATQKEKWTKPQMTELDIKETESGIPGTVEVLVLTAS